jgi:hypothetical protein
MISRMARHALLGPVLLLGIVSLAAAQQGPIPAATITGTVRSQRGTILEGARVALETGDTTVTTDARGRFRLRLIVGQRVTLRVSAVGHSPALVTAGPIAAGTTRDLVLTLDPLYLLDALAVTGVKQRPLLNTESAATGGALDAEEIAALPTDAREPLALAFTIPGVAQSTGFFGDAPPLTINGQNSLYTQYTVDGLDNNEGFLGGPRVEFPLGALARLNVSANSYGAAQGRSSNGVVDFESKAGANASTGELFAYYRPGLPFDASPKLVPAGTDPDGFRRFQFGGGYGGALIKNRLLGFVAAEYANENEDRIGSTAQTAFVGTEKRQKVKGFARFDYGWSPTQTTTLRFAYSNTDRAGNGSGVVVPEADIVTRRIGSITALTHRSALRGGRASNTASVQFGTYRWYFPPSASSFAVPQVTVVGSDGVTVQAVVGSSNFIFDDTERQVQLRNVFETKLGQTHTLQIGADAIRASFQLTGAQTNPNGAYTVYNDGNITPSGPFLSINDIPANVRVRNYTIDARPQQVDLTQSVIGAFIEDRIRVTSSFLVTAGVRWDYDDITSRGESSPDLNNVQPRASFVWARTATSVVRGGLGIYTGKLPYAVYSDAVQFGPTGNQTVTFQEGTSFPPPAFRQGPSAAALAALGTQLPAAEQRRTFALGLEQPSSRQASLGITQTVGANWALSIDGVYSRTVGLPRSVDLNAITRTLGAADTLAAPISAGDAFRPTTPAAGSFRRLTTTESGGVAQYWGLYTAARRRLSDNWTLDANWVWSRAQNDTEDINFNATQANCFNEARIDAVTGAACTSSEWADAVNDRRHKVTLRTVYTMADRVRLSLIGDWQTGQPVNRIANFRDLDGSGGIFGEGFVGNADRFPGIDRNSERLPDFFEINSGVTVLVPFGRRDLELRADVFNALNATEWGNFANGIPGGGSRTQLGRPGDAIVLRAPGRPRQFQFSARYVF